MATLKTDDHGRRGAFPAAVIFDLDGTLVDSRQDLARAANAARAALGLAPLSLAAVVGHVGDGVEMLIRRSLADGTGRGPQQLPPAEVAAALAVFSDVYAAHLVDQTRCYPGVEAMLERCAGRVLCVATNKARAFTVRILAELGLDRRFARVVAGDDISARKPAPGHLAACLEGMAIPPVRVAVVGDGLNDVQAARAYGAFCVGVTYGLTDPAVLAAARPDALASSPDEVVRRLGIVA